MTPAINRDNFRPRWNDIWGWNDIWVCHCDGCEKDCDYCDTPSEQLPLAHIKVGLDTLCHAIEQTTIEDWGFNEAGLPTCPECAAEAARRNWKMSK